MKVFDETIFSIERYYKDAINVNARFDIIGSSIEGRQILALRKGKGEFKLLVFARLHGNEPATTQSVLNFLKEYNNSNSIEINCIFLSNPDGAALYEKLWLENAEPHWGNSFPDARLNSAKIDLNRDWLELSQPETKILQKYIFEYNPDLAIDLHEFYWAESGYPPKYPTDDEDGFFATMTDCPFYLVENAVVDIAEELMYEIDKKLEKEFEWKSKYRHFIGENKRDKFENPRFLGIYLALRGIPKLLIETWGVGCSTLMLEKRVDYHYKALNFVIEFINKNTTKFEKIPSGNETIIFKIKRNNNKDTEKFIDLLKKHNLKYKKEKTIIEVTSLKKEVGFVKTLYGISTN